MTSTAPPAEPSRRELNRLATRAAIANAVLTLAEDHEWSAVTVDRVAESAGVSRRTFFNYFHSLEEALHEPLRLLVAQAALRMADVAPEPSDTLARLVDTLNEVLSLDLLQPTARVLFLARSNPGLREASLRTWDDCIQALTPPIGEGTQALRLYISAFIRAAIGSAQSAFEVWAEDIDGDVDEEQARRLRALVTQAIGLLGDGFRLPTWLSDEDVASCPPIPTLPSFG